MHFSLVLSTLGRTEEVDRFLSSLNDQTHRDFELTVVDQNPDERIVPLLEPYRRSFSIVHIQRPDDRGLSKARNVGLQNINDGVVSCPDDDCWYPAHLLELVSGYLEEYPEIDGVSGRTTPGLLDAGPESKQESPQGNHLGSPFKVMRVPGMWALFLRYSVLKTIGEFDESLGVGAGTPWGAAEDTDFYFRLLNAGFNLYATSKLVVFHPTASNEEVMLRDLGRSYRYGAGATRVWRRHGLPLWYFLYELLRSFGGVGLSLLRGKQSRARWHWGAFRGKLKGWFAK